MPDIEPLTRFEAIASGEDVQPITRAEAILAGEDVEPLTRFEYFLKMAASGGGSLEIEEGDVTLVSTSVQPTFSFSKTHDRTPDLYHICWSKSNSGNAVGAFSFLFFRFDKILYGLSIYGKTYKCLGCVEMTYYISSGNKYGTLSNTIVYDGDSGTTGNKNDVATYCTDSAMKPIYPSGSTSYQFPAGDYHWTAMWLPKLEDSSDAGRT